jgi:uncharacterized protein (TIGR03435 family)
MHSARGSTVHRRPPALLPTYLSRNRDVGKLVVDKADLAGRFKFELEWKPERTGPTAPQEPPSDDRPPIDGNRGIRG